MASLRTALLGRLAPKIPATSDQPPWPCHKCHQRSVYPARSLDTTCEACAYWSSEERLRTWWGWLEVRMVGPGWQCRSCRWRKVRPGSTRHERKEYHRVHAASAEQRRLAAEKYRKRLEAEAQEAARRAPELARLQAEEEEKARAHEHAEALKRVRDRVEAARVAAEKAEVERRAQKKAAEITREAERRKREEVAAVERSRKEEAERRRAEIDRRLLAGEDAQVVYDASLGGLGPRYTEAQVKARQLELAKLREHSGEPWAELAKDAEIERLVGQGVLRDAIKQQLGVGASRIARVRRRMRARVEADWDRPVHQAGPRRDRAIR